MLLIDKTAIICGVGPGLGRETALLMAQQGANLSLGARTPETLEAIAREVEDLGREALVVPTDITRPDDAKRIADATVDRFGRIDILVNNAGWTGPYKHLVDYEVAEWEANVDGNLVGTMAMCKYTARHMIEQRSGSIVNVTSVTGRQGMPYRSAYGAAKAGIVLMTQSLAAELGPRGIRVNCVSPGHIWSDKLKNFYEERAALLGKSYDEVYADYAGQMALHRILGPEEIAPAIMFMASDWASAMTGQSLDVNAGHYFH